MKIKFSLHCNYHQLMFTCRVVNTARVVSVEAGVLWVRASVPEGSKNIQLVFLSFCLISTSNDSGYQINYLLTGPDIAANEKVTPPPT